MKLTVNKTNVRAVDSAYPYSGQKDDTGVFDGTPLNEEWSGDYVQFFEKIFAMSNLTANGLPDNFTNGFQLVDAMEIMIAKRFLHTYNTNEADFVANKLSNISSFYYLLNLLDRGTTEIDFVFNSNTVNIVSLGNGAALGTVHNIVINQVPNGSGSLTITLNSSNAGLSPVIKMNGVTGANTVFSYVIGKTYQVIKLQNHWEILS